MKEYQGKINDLIRLKKLKEKSFIISNERITKEIKKLQDLQKTTNKLNN